MKDFTDNYLAAYERTTEHDRLMGVAAYPTYHETIRGLAKHYEAPFVQSVEAFAALSPNNDYIGNLRSLVSLLAARAANGTFEECTISTYRACGERAWSYLTGEVSFLDTVKGEKITNFRHNILYPTTSKKVTIDGHMILLAFGMEGTMTDANALLRQTKYAKLENALCLAAKKAAMPPVAMQATLWTARKRELGIKIDMQLDLFTGATKWDRPLTAEELPSYPPRRIQ